MTPVEVWWMIEANKIEKSYGKKHKLTESEANAILKDLKDERFPRVSGQSGS